MQNNNPEDNAGTHDRAENLDLIRNKQLKVLVVDDDERFRRSMSLMLSTIFDAKVKEVVSGIAALNDIRHGGHYDVIFLDLMMPEMSGLEIYRELTRLKVQSRIVLMTAFSGSEEWLDAKKLGLLLVTKPIPRDKCLEVLSAGDVE
jgi:CheY-like chemotaxis protein